MGCNCRAYLQRRALLYFSFYTLRFTVSESERAYNKLTDKKNITGHRVDFVVLPCFTLKVNWLESCTLKTWSMTLEAGRLDTDSCDPKSQATPLVRGDGVLKTTQEQTRSCLRTTFYTIYASSQFISVRSPISPSLPLPVLPGQCCLVRGVRLRVSLKHRETNLIVTDDCNCLQQLL